MWSYKTVDLFAANINNRLNINRMEQKAFVVKIFLISAMWEHLWHIGAVVIMIIWYLDS